MQPTTLDLWLPNPVPDHCQKYHHQWGNPKRPSLELHNLLPLPLLLPRRLPLRLHLPRFHLPGLHRLVVAQEL